MSGVNDIGDLQSCCTRVASELNCGDVATYSSRSYGQHFLCLQLPRSSAAVIARLTPSAGQYSADSSQASFPVGMGGGGGGGGGGG